MTQSKNKHHHELIISGYGGQGIILVGKLLAQAALNSGFQVTYMPSYGAEMRGGTAKCTIIIDPDSIDCPLVMHPDSLILMNQESCGLYANSLKTDGLAILNSTLIKSYPWRSDIRTINIPSDETAHNLGNDKCSNMVALGAWLQTTGYMTPEMACESLKDVLAKRYHDLIPINRQAILNGAELAR